MAAAVIALPPLRPRTQRYGHAPVGDQRFFASAAPTKPTGMPTTQAGAGAPSSSSSSSRNSAVGALPIATTAPPSLSRHNSIAAAVRVVPKPGGKRRNRGTIERADHLIVARQARPGDAIRDHLGVAQDRRAGLQRRDAGEHRAWGEQDVGRHLHHAAGVDDPDRDPLFVRRETREVGLAADDGERTAVNLARHRGYSCSCAATSHPFHQPAPRSGRTLGRQSRGNVVAHEVVAAVAANQRDGGGARDARSLFRSRRHG